MESTDFEYKYWFLEQASEMSWVLSEIVPFRVSVYSEISGGGDIIGMTNDEEVRGAILDAIEDGSYEESSMGNTEATKEMLEELHDWLMACEQEYVWLISEARARARSRGEEPENGAQAPIIQTL